MEKKPSEAMESPLLFMDWPKIEVEEDRIILNSSLTRVTITTSSADSGRLPSRVFQLPQLQGICY